MESRTLIAYELDEPFAAFMSSSARHSATDFTLRNADSRVCGRASGRRLVKRMIWTHADGDERDGLVHPSERGHINGLTADGTLRTDTGRVLAGTSVNDGVDEDLHRRA
jgi:hypothetical protein